MKFGSRMDVFVPVDAVLHIKVGDTVVGGVTEVEAFGRLIVSHDEVVEG